MVFEEDEVVEMPEGLKDDTMQVHGFRCPMEWELARRKSSLQGNDTGEIQVDREMKVEIAPSSTATRHAEV